MDIVSQGLRTILWKLDEGTLLSLAKTVTQGLKPSYSSDEAVENVMRHSQDPISILRRKAITKEVLFAYLDENNVKVHLPITKPELIDAVTDYWQISRGLSEMPQSDDVNVMAEQFAQWFYSMLNDNQCGPEHFFSDATLKLKLFLDNECHTKQIEHDPQEIIDNLQGIRQQYNLTFNPNTSSEGIQGRVDPYGLVLVLACGTLHEQDVCPGVFEQVFFLAKDPFCDNNWKIKSTDLNLRLRQSGFGPPRLCDSELTNDLLMLPYE
ncbi:uncharacterized protein C3orf38 homolog [Anthonomus grandis grandis]|uniref:uncharacterized protein C3orf38 homolog n=1 Tax=Anthonomus grandis grandis TaxID=2921223 RepID=UPI002165B61F|nr:uncharacterized protein C3orf38 homolog [Anthonomus grandis grandis]